MIVSRGQWLIGSLVAAATASSGCAAGFGLVVPGSGNKDGEILTQVDYNTAKVEDYHTGERGFAWALGAKAGRSWGSLGDVDLDPGIALDAHADLGYGTERFGGQFTIGFAREMATMADDTEVNFGGLHAGVIGQMVLIPRIAAHAGISRLLTGGVKVGEESGGAKGWLLGAGLDLTAYRGDKSEFVFRVDLRHARSGGGDLAGVDASYSGNAVLGEIVWITTP